MNIRKNIDYNEMYEELDMLMAQQLPQMELYCGIGKAVCQRTEKGAAVMASEYLSKQYPDVKGFSHLNLRRMRDFYRTYADHPNLLTLALQIGWVQNVVIMEAELTMELREWYMKAALQFGWSKTELITNIFVEAHESILLYDSETVKSDEYIIKLPTRNGKISCSPLQVSILLRIPKQECIISALPAAWKVVFGADGVSMPVQNTAEISVLWDLSPAILIIAIITSIQFLKQSTSNEISMKCWLMSSFIRKNCNLSNLAYTIINRKQPPL